MCQSDAAVVDVDGVCTALSWRRGDRSRQRRDLAVGRVSDLAVGRVVEDKHVHMSVPLSAGVEKTPVRSYWKFDSRRSLK